MSRADMPTPDRDPAPSSAGARRTARGIRDSDTVPPARATGGSRLGLPPKPVPGARTRSTAHSTGVGFANRCSYVHPARTSPAQSPQFGKLSAILRLGVAPAVAGTHDSSTLHWAVSTPATRRRCARSPSLPERKTARDLAHQLQFVAAERASAKGQGFGHGIVWKEDSARCQPAPGTMSRITARGARNSHTSA